MEAPPDSCEQQHLVTPDTIDPVYDHAIIDAESYCHTPATHYRVSGHFKDTPIRFNFYFPPKKSWAGSFFQSAYPLQSENADDETIAFALDSQAYAVQVTGIPGFQAEAAGARFSRTVAARYYDDASRRIYGYIYGGSGGSLQVVGAMEKSVGIWDGGIPLVQAIPISAPNNLAIRAMAGLVLRNKSTEIQEALRPGGSGDPFSSLIDVEREMLLEATKLGVPINAWEDFSAVADNSPLVLLTNVSVRMCDPTYADDFWTKPGYLGAEPSALGKIMRDALVEFDAAVEEVITAADGKSVSVVLSSGPSKAPFDTDGYDFAVFSPQGVRTGVFTGTFDHVTKTATFDEASCSRNDGGLLQNVTKGTRIHIDNRWSIAMRAYYRHQVPEREGFYGFDQFRRADGSSIFPTRPVDMSEGMANHTAGGATHTGQIKGKIIVIQNLMDSDAFPWHADWYRSQVKKSLGTTFDDNYRIWYNESADHYYEGPGANRSSLLVPFRGICQQALRDLSAWVERDIPPPASTSYNVGEDNSIRLRPTAASRGGIQPTIRLTVEGSQRATARVGQRVVFQAVIETPPGAGKVVSVEWDFFGNGDFVTGPLCGSEETVVVETSFAFGAVGDYVVGLRATSQRQGDANTPFAKVMNLARVFVKVDQVPTLGKTVRL